MPTRGEIIQAARRRANLTQQELAKQVDSSEPTIRRLEADKPNVEIALVERVAHRLKLPLNLQTGEIALPSGMTAQDVEALVRQPRRGPLATRHADANDAATRLRELAKRMTAIETLMVESLVDLRATGKVTDAELDDLAEQVKATGALRDRLREALNQFKASPQFAGLTTGKELSHRPRKAALHSPGAREKIARKKKERGK